MGLPITLYQALRSAKVGSDEAEAVVEEVEGHITMKVTEANAALIAKLDATQEIIKATQETIKTNQQAMNSSFEWTRWFMIGLFVVNTAAIALGGYLAAILK